jgi:tetratricopeptide (TPR) repeat protein
VPQDRRHQKTNLTKAHPALALISTGFLVAAVVMVVHWPALSARALSFDDNEYLIENHLVQHPSWNSAGRFLSEVLEPSMVQGYYQPLTLISLMLDVAMGGSPDNLRPFHRTSLLLHAANAVLVMLLLYMVFGHLPAAVIAAILFGLHPMTVETIPWIGERKTLLAALFGLLSLIAYVRFAGRGDEARGKVSQNAWYATSLGCYVLAIMSKPTATPLPILMLLMDVWPLKRMSKRAAFEKIPFLVIAGISSTITIISQRRTLGASLPTENNPLCILLLLCHNLMLYLKHLFWPIHLSSHYPVPKPLDLSNGAILAGVIGTIVLSLVLWLSTRWTRALLIGWLFFFIGLLPTLGIIGFTSTAMADKFAYLPALGLLLALAFAIKQYWRFKSPVIGVFVILGCAETLLTPQYLAHWQTTETLCNYMVEVTPEAAIPHNSLANILFEQGRLDEAVAHFNKSIELDPHYAYSHYNLANALAKQEQNEDAIREYREAIRLRPKLAQAYINLGAVMMKTGNLHEAADNYQEGLRIRHDSPVAHFNLALVLAQLGDLPEAIEHLRIAVALKPDFTAAQNALDQATGITHRN